MQLVRDLFFGGVAPSSIVAESGLALLRIGAGLMMAIGSGLPKVPPGEQFVGMVEGLGFPLPLFFAWLAGLAEFVGGLLLAAGILTRPAAAALLVTMLVAVLGAHAGDPLLAAPGEPSAEKAALYGLVALAFVAAGSGRLSGDYLLRGWYDRLMP